MAYVIYSRFQGHHFPLGMLHIYLALTLPNSMFSFGHLLFFWILEFRYVLGKSTYMTSLQ